VLAARPENGVLVNSTDIVRDIALNPGAMTPPFQFPGVLESVYSVCSLSDRYTLAVAPFIDGTFGTLSVSQTITDGLRDSSLGSLRRRLKYASLKNAGSSLSISGWPSPNRRRRSTPDPS